MPSAIAAPARVRGLRLTSKSSSSRISASALQHREKGDRVDEEADAGAAEADDHTGDCGADDARAVEEARVQRDRVRQLVAADHLEGQRLPARRVDDERGAAEEREQVNDRDVLPAGRTRAP